MACGRNCDVYDHAGNRSLTFAARFGCLVLRSRERQRAVADAFRIFRIPQPYYTMQPDGIRRLVPRSYA